MIDDLKKRRRIRLAGIAIALAIAAVVATIAVTGRIERRRLATGGLPATETTPMQTIADLSPDQWTSQFSLRIRNDEWASLADELETIRDQHPALYERWKLGYLHGRSLLEAGERSDAAKTLKPFTEKEDPFRDLALFHLAEALEVAGEDAEASARRRELIFEHPGTVHWDEAVEDELAYLDERELPRETIAFADRLHPSAPSGLRRDLEARRIRALVALGETDEATRRSLALMKGSSADDAAEIAFRTIDTPSIIDRLSPEQWVLLGETARNHRHFDRAAELLIRARRRLPQRVEELDFAIGRSYFGNEKFTEAEEWYVRGAREAKSASARALFWFHASRAAQLKGNDERGERYLTSAVGVSGNFRSTAAALTQRIRTRVRQKRYDEAASDVALLKRLFPRSHALVEGALAHAVGLVAAEWFRDAVAVLDSIPDSLLEPYDRSEIRYWKARALERDDPSAAVKLYLAVLADSRPTHFQHFSAERIASDDLATHAASLADARRADAARAAAEEDWREARRAATDVVHLTGSSPESLQQLRAIYENIDDYRAVLELEPARFPSFPLEPDDSEERAALLMAMGLFDDAAADLPELYPLRPMSSALTQSLGLANGASSRPSIYAIEVMMRSVPDDFVPELLPDVVRQLLHPRYFYEAIVADSERHGADPQLVLSIMREESRFNPRAKSLAAARGLLQFILTTALDVGRSIGLVDLDSQDLYDPRIIIQLGTRYVSDLLDTFDGNSYMAVAAYNAGPYQTRLWRRLSAGEGNDYFLTAINFDETKHYVRKVMNSYYRYGEVYGRPAS